MSPTGYFLLKGRFGNVVSDEKEAKPTGVFFLFLLAPLAVCLSYGSGCPLGMVPFFSLFARTLKSIQPSKLRSSSARSRYNKKERKRTGVVKGQSPFSKSKT